MREKILFLFVFLFLLDIAYAAPNVEISEIMYDPTNIVSGAAKDAFRCVNDSSCQWIELHNKENTAIDLSTWKIKVNTKTNGNDIYDFSDIIVQPNGYAVIVTQLGDEDSDGFSFSTLYGNKDGVWDSSTDGFVAVDSGIPFIKTPNVGPDSNPDVDIRLLDGSGSEVNTLFFQAHFNGPTHFVQKSNGYSMEKDVNGNFVQSLDLGGSPGKGRGMSPVFSSISNISLNEDQNLQSRLIDFRNFVSDADTNDNDLVFSITNFSANPSNLITCGLIGNETDISKTFFLNCTNLGVDLNGKADLTISASDGSGSGEKSFSIIVNPVNDAPSVTSTAVETAVAGLEYNYDVNASDLEDNEISYSLLNSPAGMSINSSTGLIEWIPNDGQIGNNNVEVRVSDAVANAKSSTQEFIINVQPIFGFSNVDVDYSGGSLSSVNNTQTLQRVFTSSEFNIMPTLLNRQPVKDSTDIVVDDIEVSIKLEKNNNIVFEDTILSGFSLSSLESRQLDYSFVLPRDLQPGIYKLTLEAEGDLFDIDENFRDVIKPQSRKFELMLDVQQSRHDIFISNIRVNDGQVCSANSNLEVTVQNSGTRTERDAQLVVNYLPLAINSLISIDQISSGENSNQVIEFTNAPGIHNVTATIIYNNGQSSSSEILENFQSCTEKGDFNGDACVNQKDVDLLVSKIGLMSSSTGFDSKLDVVKDNIIDAADFFYLSDIFGRGCSTTISDNGNNGQVPITGEGFSLDLAQIKLLVQEGSSIISKLKITNKGNSLIGTKQSFNGEVSFEDKKITLDFPAFLSILPSKSSDIEIKTAVPSEFKPGVYTGTFKIETNTQSEIVPVDIEVFPDICSNGVIGEDISITIDDPNRNEDFKPGETISVDLTVRNKGKTRDVSVEGILWNVDTNDEVESVDADSVELDSGDSEKDDFDFEITVPEDVDDDKIVLYIKAYDDSDEDSQCVIESSGLDVKRDKNDVRITSVVIPESLTCNSKVSLKLSARNFGKDNDDGVYFRVVNQDLGIDLNSEVFELKEFDRNGDSITKIISFDVPDKEVEKTTFVLEVVYKESAERNSLNKEVTVLCDENVSQTITQQSGTDSQDNEISGESVVESTQREVSNNLLVNTSLFLAVMLGLGILSYLLKLYILMKK